jgi:hypothetical protein
MGRVLEDTPNPDLNRLQKLELLTAIVGREVESSRALHRDEGYRALDYLQRLQDGSAGMWRDDMGTLHVSDFPPELVNPDWGDQ